MKGINLFFANFGNFGAFEQYPGNSAAKYYNFFEISKLSNTEKMDYYTLLNFETVALAKLIFYMIFPCNSESYQDYLRKDFL